MKSILIVDDEPDILDLLTHFLSEDYRIVTASNGKEALAKAADEKPDLLISDIIMPDIDGIETISKIRSQLPNVRIITMSGLGNELYLQTSKALGANVALTKPLKFMELKDQIAELLRD